jgi:hypothetical protein
LTESSLQAKLGVRDETLLKKVDNKIQAAIAQYEQKIKTQTQTPPKTQPRANEITTTKCS